MHQDNHSVQWRRPLLLSITLFALGSIAFWLEYSYKPKKEANEEQSKKLFALKDTSSESIQIGTAAQIFEFKCMDVAAKLCKMTDPSKWELSLPLKTKADDGNANALLSAIGNLNSNEGIDLKDEKPDKREALLKEYGLDAAVRKAAQTRRIGIKAGATTTTLYLGKTHPVGDAIFALLEKNDKPDETRVFLIPSYFKTNFERNLTYWRDKKVLSLAANQVAGFQLESPKGSVRGQRNEGRWLVGSTELEFSGDPDQIDNLLTGATFLNAKDFAADLKSSAAGKKLLSGAKKEITLSLQPESDAPGKAPPSPLVLTFYYRAGPKKAGKAVPTDTGKLYLTVSSLDPLYEVDTYTKDRLTKTTKDLRLTKLITSMERFGTKSLKITGKPVGAVGISLILKEGKWYFEKGNVEANSTAVQEFLDQLAGNRIKDFVKKAPGAESEGIKLQVGDHAFSFWKHEGKAYARDHALGQGGAHALSHEVFELDTLIEKALPWSPDYFKKKTEEPGKSK